MKHLFYSVFFVCCLLTINSQANVLDDIFAPERFRDRCFVELQDNYRSVRTFESTGRSHSYACQEAMRMCKREIDARRRRGHRTYNLHCVSRRGNDYGQSSVCRSNMLNRRGRVIESFRGRGQNKRQACRKALRKCNREIPYSSRGVSCVVDRIGQNPLPPRNVSASCRVERIGKHGRLIQTHRSSAFGRSRAQAKLNACNEAQRSCQRARVRRQVCRQSY